EYRMTPSDVIKYFSNELTPSDIEKIYSFSYPSTIGLDMQYAFENYDNDAYINTTDGRSYINTVRVLHCVWKSLRRIGFLTYIDVNGEEQEMIIDENYKLNKQGGDVLIKWEYIPEVYETWKINNNIYLNMRPVPGQFKDMDNLYECKLPYYGAVYDNLNSVETSLMERLKSYQYFYNILMYKIEILIASDKGKKILMNINAIPKSTGIDVKKWMYFMESSPVMFVNPSEEGSNLDQVGSLAKEIDLSLASDIQKYINLAEYIKQQQGKSVGITEAVEGQIGPDDAVKNTQQSLVQTSHILEPYFNLHATVKGNILQALIETAKVAYSNNKSNNVKLNYILDDMSKQILDLDVNLLNNSTLGIFVSNSAKAEEAKEVIRQLAHAALQNQKIELSDVIAVIRQEGIVEAEETLKVAEERKRNIDNKTNQENNQAMKEEGERGREFEREKFEQTKELIVLKETERRKTVELQATITAASFNPDEDENNDGINDFLQLSKHDLDIKTKNRKLDLDEKKLEVHKDLGEKKLKLDEKKLNKTVKKQ
ncbi:MAG: hypothetical protein ACRC0V_07195, partial [Fusobacteriaceae bacterium]|uniref:hypothetical protein n=1 Tax=Romboutsia sp. TaxID=1965302 RepID=UPI003F38792F